jgi:PEP-CTERM motif
MKRLTLAFVLVLAVAFFALAKAPAYAQNLNGCGPSDNRPKKCDPVAVPEPDSFTLLAVGLVAVGGLTLVLRRKQAAQN